MDSKTENKIDRLIQKHIKKFSKPNVFTVRPGFKMTGGWVTDKPAIVATVDKKLDGLTPKQMLPSEVEDMPVDVREATGMQRLRHNDPKSFDLVIKHSRGEHNEPIWPKERDAQTGALINKPISNMSKKGVKSIPKKQIPYTPAGQPLAPFQGNLTITAYATPDAQVTVLKDFLNATSTSLEIAMYDFTSAEILDTVVKKISPGKVDYTMVLDHPPRNPDANQTDDVTKQQILQAGTAHKNASVNWALTRNDPAATEWIFPSAYHIKVAVRDDNSFWLSSGNFNVTNQPDLAGGNHANGGLDIADRDWHVIVQNDALAKMFKAYILHDFTVAAGGQSEGNAATRQAIHDAMVKLKAEQDKSSKLPEPRAKAGSFTLGLKRDFTNVPVTIQPLLTPDKGKHSTMYVDQVLQLIQSAQQKVYMQTQYIHPSDLAADADFMLLVNAMVTAHQQGKDVRLITSQFENTAQWVEKLKEIGLDKVLRIQNRVHNKGIVVDSKVVMVSSQNWSSAGTLFNRDAGLIIHHPDIAAYFEAIFIEDWTQRASQKLADVSHMASGTTKAGGKSKGKKKAPVVKKKSIKPVKVKKKAPVVKKKSIKPVKVKKKRA